MLDEVLMLDELIWILSKLDLSIALSAFIVAEYLDSSFDPRFFQTHCILVSSGRGAGWTIDKIISLN